MNLEETLKELGSSHRRMLDKNWNQVGYCDLFSIDLVGKTIKNGEIYLVKDGKIIPQTITLYDGEVFELENEWGYEVERGDFYDELEQRFANWYSSYINKGSRYAKSSFRVKSKDELTPLDWMHGMPRNRARYDLEGFVIANAVKGNIKWDNDKHFFWKSEKYPQLILYKRYL